MDVMAAIQKRRSIRNYLPKPVEEKKLKSVLEAGRLAPSAHNAQEWKFIVVKDAETRKKLAEACRNQSFIAEAPVVIVGCGLNPAKKMSGGQFSCPIDLAIAVDHMTLKAVEEDLGTCWIGSYDEPAVKTILKIPAEVNVVAIFPLGYPAVYPKPRPRKNFIEVFVSDRWA